MTFVVISALVIVAMLGVIIVATMSLVEAFGVFPAVAFAGNSSKKQTSGEQVKSFHLRRV